MTAILATLSTTAPFPHPINRTSLPDLAAALGYRNVEMRLSCASAYVEFRAVTREQHVRTLRKAVPQAYTAATERSDGLSYLILNDPIAALEAFEQAGGGAPTDVAAAHYMRGMQTQSLNDFSRALQTLSTAPESPAVTFGRALILEQFGDSEGAAAEWKRYLKADATTRWAREARRRLQDDLRPTALQTWPLDEPRLIAAARRGDETRLAQLVARYPLGARRVVERKLLPAWAETSSERDLAAARRCASILARRGDRLLLEVIDEIEAATPPQRARLAKAYPLYAQAIREIDRYEFETAAELVARASAHGSRFSKFHALLLPVWAAVRFAQNQRDAVQPLIDEAHARYGAFEHDYPALFARLDWIAGLVHVGRGEASEAISSYSRALGAYERLGETENVAAQEVNIADTQATYLEQTDQAGVHLRRALLLASQAETPNRLLSALTVATDAMFDEAGSAAALSFQERLVRMARSSGSSERIADALITSSLLFARAGRRSEALATLAQAVELAKTVRDVQVRQRLLADAAPAEAFAYGDSDDAAAIRSLSRAIRLYERIGFQLPLPQLLLQRGRAHLRSGQTAEAETDFRAGLAKLEHQRRRLHRADHRIAFFDRADRLFVDLGELLLRRGHEEEAFDLLERLRSRELLDRSSGKPMLPMPVAEIRRSLTPGTILLSITATRERLFVFAVTRSSLRVFEEPIGAKKLAEITGKVTAAFGSSAPLPQPELRRLGELLIDRAAPPLESRLVFIPDPVLDRVPFAALRTAGGHYLIEEQTVAVAPSATLFLKNCRRAQAVRRQPSLFALASSRPPKAFPDLQPLVHTVKEVERIATYYPRHRVVMNPEGAPNPFLAAARDYDVFQFSGHGYIDADEPDQSALLVGESGRITAREIEKAALAHVRLVILGGCNTGVGKSHRSEGVMSLARAFMVASVPSVVGTIASVEDPVAARLLTSFHRAYTEGLDPAAALRKAQLLMLRDPRVAEPAQWSAFQIVGGACAPVAEREEVAKSWRSH